MFVAQFVALCRLLLVVGILLLIVVGLLSLRLRRFVRLLLRILRIRFVVLRIVGRVLVARFLRLRLIAIALRLSIVLSFGLLLLQQFFDQLLC